jgi:hypothetical protein
MQSTSAPVVIPPGNANTNPSQALCYKPFGGNPSPAALNRMDPKNPKAGDESPQPPMKRANADK